MVLLTFFAVEGAVVVVLLLLTSVGDVCLIATSVVDGKVTLVAEEITMGTGDVFVLRVVLDVVVKSVVHDKVELVAGVVVMPTVDVCGRLVGLVVKAVAMPTVEVCVETLLSVVAAVAVDVLRWMAVLKATVVVLAAELIPWVVMAICVAVMEISTIMCECHVRLLCYHYVSMLTTL